MPRPHPHFDPEGFWPSCDDQQPGVSIRPLNQADLAALLAHLHHYPAVGPAPGRPVVAVRVRASVGLPGASAAAEYRRRLAAAQVAPHLAVPTGVTVTAGLAWVLRFHVSADALAWRRGAAGERRTAR